MNPTAGSRFIHGSRFTDSALGGGGASWFTVHGSRFWRELTGAASESASSASARRFLLAFPGDGVLAVACLTVTVCAISPRGCAFT